MRIDGTSPVSRDLLIRVVTNISRIDEQFLSRGVGKGSREQVVAFICEMIECTTADVTSVKLLKGGARGVLAVLEAIIFVLMVSIFVFKKISEAIALLRGGCRRT